MGNDEAGAACSADEQMRLPLPEAARAPSSVSRLTDGQLRAMQLTASGCQVAEGIVAVANVPSTTPQAETLAALFANSPALLLFYRRYQHCQRAIADADEAAYTKADAELSQVENMLLSSLGVLA